MTEPQRPICTDPITVEVAVAAAMLKMRTIDHREQLEQDDALSVLLGRQVLAMARRKLHARDLELA